MANIRPLPSGSWNVQVRIKGQASLSKSFRTEEQARAWAEEQEALRKRHRVHTLYTLGMAYREARLKGKGSYLQALVITKQLAQAFPQSIQDITPKMVNDFKLARLAKVKSATCRSQLAFMSRLFKFAKRELLIDIANPLADIALPAPSKASDKVVSKEELDRLLAKLNPSMALVVELAYETAMRRSEILKLTPSCLHLGERIADVVDGKNGTRSVPLTHRAIELLEASLRHPKGKPLPDSRLFALAPHSVSTAVRRARNLAGLDRSVKLHQLRHTRITAVARKGFNNAQIMIVSGHRDTRSVARYSHLSVKDVLHLID